MRPPESWSKARLTLALTLATAAVWFLLYTVRLDEAALLSATFIPHRVTSGAPGLIPVWLTPLSSAFLHAGPIHLGFNLLILVFCGRPTEAVLGAAGLAILYLVGAYAAAAAHYLVDPASPVPMIGASGAISAVLGAYALLFGRNKVKIANPTLALWLNALWLMLAWVVLNVIVGYVAGTAGFGIAFAAHIGGFIAGLALANPLLLLRYRKA